MTPLAALAAAGLAAAAAAAAPAAPPDVRIEGDVSYQPGSGVLLVENGAVLRRGAVTIRARSATYDPATGEVRAAGGVLLTGPTRVIRADAIRAVLEGEWEAEGVIAFVKDTPVDLGAVETLEAARARGRNRFTFSGSRLRGDAARFQLDDARLTLCDCGPGRPPSWEVTSAHADVIPGRRAILTWPVLKITPRFLFVNPDGVPGLRPVPVLVLPWLYVPLGDRQTGLLLPEIASTAATGFALAQPLFVTLGRSADATLTAEYAFGRDAGDVAQGKPAIRGPGARLELRWAPAEGAAGSVELAWIHDLDREPGGEGGDRFALTGGHAQRIGAATTLAAGLQLAGDPVWVRDHTSDVYAQLVPYRRSAVLVSHRREDVVVEGGAAYHQPLSPAGMVEGARYGPFGADVGVASRWPGLAATLLPAGLGPLQLSGRIGAARYAPVSAAVGSLDAAGRPSAMRADARLELAAPVLLGGALTVSPFVRGAGAGYAFEGGFGSVASAWGVGGLSLSTEVSRRFGALQHAIAPRLEWRAGTGADGGGPPGLAYDAFDRSGAGLLSSGPPGAWQQLRAAVATRLSRGAADLVRMELGQDLDLRAGRFGETFASAGASAGWIGVDAGARSLAVEGRSGVPAPRIPLPWLDRFTELRANAAVTDPRGDSLHVGFFSVAAGGSGTLVAGLDPLFDLRPAPVDASAALSAGARAVLGGASLAYDVSFPGRAAYVGACSGGGERRIEAWHVQQHAATFVWDSPCRCFRVAATARVTDCGDVSYSASIDLSRLAAARFVP